MKKLEKIESRDILTKLLELFGNSDTERLEKYLDSKPFCWKWGSFGIGHDRHTLPFLFWDGREIRGKYDNMLYLSASATKDDGKRYSLSGFDFFKKVAEYLINNFVNKFYAAGNWSALSELGHYVLLISPKELGTIAHENIGFDDIYFFAKDFSWMLAFNHHNLGFFAGPRGFIEGFADFYPGYRRFMPENDACPCN